MRTRAALCVTLTTLVTSALLTGPALAEPGPEQIVNGTFDSGSAPWWSTANAPIAVVNGELCAEIPAGTANPWDAILGQNDIDLVQGEGYRLAFTAHASRAVNPRTLVQENADPWPTALDTRPAITTTPNTFEYFFTAGFSTSNGQFAIQAGALGEAYTLCIDNVSLTGGVAEPPYEPETGPRVRVNQVGYLPNGPKKATLVTDSASPVPWQLNQNGKRVASGTSTPAGAERTSGLNVHTIDFTRYTKAGTGFTLVADGETSHPFDLGSSAYDRLKVDSLSVYYPWRSGIAIDDAIAPGYGRPAGHIGVAPNQGDISVPCAPGTCDYSLDVSGGWYDAADHGKYVVNGGLAVHQVMSNFERTKTARTAQAPATLRVPEAGNAVPDVLDEARWELEFLLKMQVPAGKPLAGMVHHKIHDAAWTGLPLWPHLDPQPRYLQPPSTAATLNLAAAAAQAARLYAPYDPAFSAKALAAAKTAWKAALANPAIYAPAGGVGGGPYDDTDVTDEFYWAAAELFITTGAAEYRDYVLASPHHSADVFTDRSFAWPSVAVVARLELATVPNKLPGRDKVAASVVAGANRYVANVRNNPWGLSFVPENNIFDWGSNSTVLNNLVVIATAFDLTNDRKYRDAVIEGMDYILGRNALNQSYVTGYGEQHSQAMHSRWFANSINPDMPKPPVGSIAGGPNSVTSTWDPVAADKLPGCESRPQWCYIDDIGSWSTNEIAINWGSTLSWVAAFVADQDNGGPAPSTDSCKVTYTSIDVPGSPFVAVVTVTNTGAALREWSLSYAYSGGQRVVGAVGAAQSQVAASVTLSGGRLARGQTAIVGLVATNAAGLANASPSLFKLNGSACR
ncbi:endoglucanase [Virgisporangium ochraceum]|uniref:Endoglucanase n=1 Tax=Virgisporangium ochraceum TaxID=65505 RepID=A0A8J4EBN6_9ACTN|nr:glycoside hydrolase family 9 protein [Virgisporangium ochraceum]GIJ66027.1 endoglucanase [Virgisporangium ochraceum]